MARDIDHLPEFERKVLGVHETIELPVSQVVRLPQVRSGMNPELPNLKDSIKTRGLINQIDVACMTEEKLGEYIGFVNQTWGTEVKIEDYLDLIQPDGAFYLAVAGHSRMEAIAQLQEEDQGNVEYWVVGKVHAVESPEEIIALQLDENIHSKPPQEQRAIAVVEAYYYGLRSGLWTNKKEFLEQSHGKFSRRILNEAIGFSQLPPDARDFVFSKQLSYNAAVALGQATGTILEHTALRLGYEELPQVVTPEFEAAYTHRIGLIIAEISNRSLNGTAAKKFIQGWVTTMQSEIDKIRGDTGEDALFDLSLVSTEEQARMYLNKLRTEYRTALRDMRHRSIGSVSQALALHRRLVGETGDDDLERELERRETILGESALHLLVETPS